MFINGFFFPFLYLVFVVIAQQIFTSRQFRILLLLVTNLFFLYLISPLSMHLFVFAGAAHLLLFQINQKNKKKFAFLFLLIWIFAFVFFKSQSANFALGYDKKNIVASELMPFGFSYLMFFWLSYLLDRIDSKFDFSDKSSTELFCLSTFIGAAPAGPYLSTSTLRNQLFRKPTAIELQYGFVLICWGLVKKFLSDEILQISTQQTTWLQNESWLDSWSLSLLVPARFYLDFSGVSDLAIGIAQLFGIQIPANFNLPFLAEDVADYWRRWHISLGTWFREYLFLRILSLRYRLKWLKKLSASHVSFFAAACVFAIIGLWHGLQLNFFVWSIYVFITYILSNLFGRYFLRHPKWVRIFVTFYLMMWGQLILIHTQPNQVFSKWLWMHNVSKVGQDHLVTQNTLLFAFAFLIIIIPHLLDAKINKFSEQSKLVRLLTLITVMTLAFLFGRVETPYLYSRF